MIKPKVENRCSCSTGGCMRGKKCVCSKAGMSCNINCRCFAHGCQNNSMPLNDQFKEIEKRIEGKLFEFFMRNNLLTN